LLFSIFYDGAGVGRASESVTGILGRWEFFRSAVLARSTAGVFSIGIANPPRVKKPSAARLRAGHVLQHKILEDMVLPQVRQSEAHPTIISWVDADARPRVALITLAALQFIGDLVSHYFVGGIISGRNLFYLADGHSGMLPKDVGCEHVPGTTIKWSQRLRCGLAASRLYNQRDTATSVFARATAVRSLERAGLHATRPSLIEALFRDLKAGHAGTTRIDPLHTFATVGAVGAQVLDHIVGYIQESYPQTAGGALSPEAGFAVARYAARIMEGRAFDDGVTTPVAKIYNYDPGPRGEGARRTGAFEKAALSRALSALDSTIIPIPARLAIARGILERTQRVSNALRCREISDSYAVEASALVVELAALSVEHFRGSRYYGNSVDDEGVRTTSVKFFYLWACFQPWALRFGAPSSGSASIFERFLKLVKDAYDATNKGAMWRLDGAQFMHLRHVTKRYLPELLNSSQPPTLIDGAQSFTDFKLLIATSGASCVPSVFEDFARTVGDCAIVAPAPLVCSLTPRDDSTRVEFVQRVMQYAGDHPAAFVVPVPGTPFEATGPKTSPGSTLATLCADWSPPVQEHLLQAMRKTCRDNDAALARCLTIKWLKIKSPELNKRIYPGDVVAFLSLEGGDEDNGEGDDASAAPADDDASATLPETPAVLYPHNARYTTIGSVQAMVNFGGAFYVVLHSYARPSLSLINSVAGITVEKNCPRILGSTLGHAPTKTPPHLLVVVAEHIGWKVHDQPLHNDDKIAIPPLGYPSRGPPRIFYSSRPDPEHP